VLRLEAEFHPDRDGALPLVTMAISVWRRARAATLRSSFQGGRFWVDTQRL
jgi:hypothetical protein